MQSYDRSQMDYELQSRRSERILDKRAQNYSEEGKLLDKRIREIYNNGTLTERQACDAAANLINMATPQIITEVDLEPIDCEQIFTSIFD
ncbi:hypothetical protein M3Y97_01101800 [Aphelenchoides bicaudatus]|nr:hypothetical protein M3Y97_01101800 [Aphelenchoides bicaudatus]